MKENVATDKWLGMLGDNIPNSENPKDQRFTAIFEKMTECSKSAKNRRFTRINARTVEEGLIFINPYGPSGVKMA